jgi:hypothetical protein
LIVWGICVAFPLQLVANGLDRPFPMGPLEDAGLAPEALGGQRLVAAGEGLDELKGLVGDHEKGDEGLEPLRAPARL